MSLIVLGTDTEVGKTVVSTIVLHRYANVSRLAYWKPIASGSVEGRDLDNVRTCAPPGIEWIEEVYSFRAPLSPHLAARMEGRKIDTERVLGVLVEEAMARPDRTFVIEGVGGLLVPLTDDGELLIDLVVAMALPCIIVARSGLGTINHTLLSLEAARARQLEVAGVVLNGPSNPENRLAIERFGEVEVVAEIEPLKPLSAQACARASRGFDPDARLQHYFE